MFQSEQAALHVVSHPLRTFYLIIFLSWSTIDWFPPFCISVARLIWKILPIFSSCCTNLTDRFASGSGLISCHIIWCFVWVTLALNGEAEPAAAMIRKVFIGKWCFLNRNKPCFAITARLIAAKSFIFRFSLRFFFSALLLECCLTPYTIDTIKSALCWCFGTLRLRKYWVMCCFFWPKQKFHNEISIPIKRFLLNQVTCL